MGGVSYIGSAVRNAGYAARSAADYALHSPYIRAFGGAAALMASATPAYAFHGGDDMPLAVGGTGVGLFVLWTVIPSLVRNRRK